MFGDWESPRLWWGMLLLSGGISVLAVLCGAGVLYALYAWLTS